MASKVGEAWISCLPLPRNAKAAMRRISVDPHPRTTSSGFTWWRLAIRSAREAYSMRGYRLALPMEDFMAFATLVDGPHAFSLLFKPIRLLSCSPLLKAPLLWSELQVPRIGRTP